MHSCLYVIHQKNADIDALLAPFNECNEEYYEFDYDEDHCYPIDEITPEEAEAEGMVLDDDGEFYGYYCNTKGQYDWYEIGGRWEDLLPLKDGRYVNSAKIKDIDIDKLMPPAYYYDESSDEWNDTGMLILQPASEDQVDAFRRYIRRYDDPETIITIVDIHY